MSFCCHGRVPGPRARLGCAGPMRVDIRSLRVLLVDVDVETAASTIHRLTSRGHRPTRVDDAAQAREIADDGRFDIALIQFGLFDAVASESARALSQAVPGLPLMALVRRAEPFQRPDMDGLAAFLMNPLDVQTLEKAFTFVLQVRAAESLEAAFRGPRGYVSAKSYQSPPTR